jgi:UDP-3-O-[3-hydroxymyristoyl] glucosamine N-acyltransferase
LTVVPDDPELGLRSNVKPRAVGVAVMVAVGEGVSVGVPVAVGEGATVGVPVALGNGVRVAVGVLVELGAAVTVNCVEPRLSSISVITSV